MGTIDVQSSPEDHGCGWEPTMRCAYKLITCRAWPRGPLRPLSRLPSAALSPVRQAVTLAD